MDIAKIAFRHLPHYLFAPLLGWTINKKQRTLRTQSWMLHVFWSLFKIGMGWYGPKRVWVIGFSTPKWWLQVLQMSNSLLHLYTCGIMRIWYVCTKILLYMHKTGGGSNVNMYLYLHNTKNNDTLLDINRICRLLKYLCITVYIYIQLIATKT